MRKMEKLDLCKVEECKDDNSDLAEEEEPCPVEKLLHRPSQNVVKR